MVMVEVLLVLLMVDGLFGVDVIRISSSGSSRGGTGDSSSNGSGGFGMATVVFESSSSLGFGDSVLRSSVSSSGISLLLAELVTTTLSSKDGCGEEDGLPSFNEGFGGGDGACSFLGDFTSSSTLVSRSNVNGEAGFEITVVSGRSTPLFSGVCGVSGGVGGTVVWEDELTPIELGAFRLLGDEGV